jgi:phage shock protein A
MANPFVKGWKYLMALFGSKIDEYADPKVQIQQAIEDAQRQHQALVQQAAAVIGNQRQLEMKLSRQLGEVEQLTGNARQALVLADRARTDGDGKKASDYESTAQTFATQLVAAEASVEDLKALHDQALSAATQARKAVENNAMVLQQKLAERTKLLSQLEQAKMQETVARSLESMSQLSAPGTTPSLEEVRDKIERRYATALGRADLGSTSVEGRHGAAATLVSPAQPVSEEIRRRWHPPSRYGPTDPPSGAPETPAVTAGEEPEIDAASVGEKEKEQA